MWESPIEVIWEEQRASFENDVFRMVQSYDISVNKDELIKALKYDREQYEKGYKDGCNANKPTNCEDCCYWSEQFSLKKKDGTIVKQYCMNLDKMTEPDFFCKYGEGEVEICGTF